MKEEPHNIMKRDEGSSILETALVLPILLLLLIGAIDFGRAYYLAIEVASAARAGALYGALNPQDTAGMIQAAKLDASDVTSMVPTATFGCECSDGTSVVVGCVPAPICTFNVVSYVEVTTTATYSPSIPYTGIGKSFSLSGRSRMRAAR